MRRTTNGSVFREIVPLEPPRACTDQSQWLLTFLDQRQLKAYKPDVNISDPKERRAANEVTATHWCAGDQMKLWSSSRCEPADSQANDDLKKALKTEFGINVIVSRPTQRSIVIGTEM